MSEAIQLGSQCFANLLTPTENFLVSCGNWDNSFQVVSLSDGKVVQSIRRHKDVVSCVAGIHLVIICPFYIVNFDFHKLDMKAKLVDQLSKRYNIKYTIF